MNALEVSHLSKRYGEQTVVDDLSFFVQPGEVFGLIGPNGAGKSTTMLIIVGLIKADGGTVLFEGQRHTPRDAKMRSRLGIVPQEIAVYPELSALQNLRFFGRLQGLSGRKLNERVDEVLQLTGLTPSADHTVATFSGGMSRRLNFGIALLHEPSFVVLDEPTVGIDPQSRTNLLDGVRDLSRRGVGVLYASHYMEEIEAICNRVAIIDRGKMLRQGTLDQLLDRSPFDFQVRVASLPTDLSESLGQSTEISSDDEGAVNIVIRESADNPQSGGTDRLRAVLEKLDQARIPVQGITTPETSLETLFLSLTGRTLRD